MTRILVISDLDGTLLDGSYSFAAAEPALRLLAEHAIPLILCSSKTRAELEYYRVRLDNHHPFISENGGGIFIPDGYFPPGALPPRPTPVATGNCQLLPLGTPYPRLRQCLRQLRHEGFDLTGFGDLDVATITRLTGLPPEQARLALARDFDEPFLFSGSAEEEARLHERVRRDNLHLTCGRLWHLLGNSDKGRAVALLLDCYRADGTELLTIGLGDQRNDFPLLEQVDVPVLIRQPEGGYAQGCAARDLRYSSAVGPAGWDEMVRQLVTAFLRAQP